MFLRLFYRIIFTASILVASFALSSTNAFAMAEYKVWYFDDITAGPFQEGDISDGWTKLIPPDWACGLLFEDPSYYRWIGANAATIGSGNFWKDVRVWIPRPGCPENEPLIEYTDGSKIFPHKPGGRYMEISTHYAVRWIDENGEYPWCSNCTSVGDFQYFPPDIEGPFVGSIATLKSTLLIPSQQLFVTDTIAALEADLRGLRTRLQKQVEERRRYDLADREASVRSLEANADRRLAEAEQNLSACQQLARELQFTEAYVACDLGAEGVAAAQSLLATAQYVFQDDSSKSSIR